MALSKKKGSFTLGDQTAGDAERISGKAGGGSNSVRVMLLDGSVLTVGPADKKMLGQVAFDQVVRKLDLLERDYFGLMYEDDHKTMQWLDLLKPIKKQLKRQPYTLFFRVKFYAVDPLALHRNSKEQFYLQLKEDISAGRLRFSSESAHSVLSYVLQADVGDYSNSHDDLQYLERKGFLILGKDRTAESSIIKLHKLLQGKTPDQAVEKFLRKTRELDYYGAIFNVVQYEGIPYRMGMSPSGITLYQDMTRTAHYKWRKILQVSYKQKRFTFTLKSRSTEGGEKTVTYEMESVKRCKEMWEHCVERVSFYNDHQARYMERSERGNAQSRSPSPPTMREYATINDATPQLQASREQQSPQSSPTHSSQQEEKPHSKQKRQKDGGEGGAMEREERRERHRERRNEDQRERDREAHSAVGDKIKPRRREREENRLSSAHRHSRSPPSNGVMREGSEEKEGEGDTLKRRSRSSATSLPRRLPSGDPMLHHMMQFQNLEYHSSRGTLLSDSDSAAETTSPVVSTCDEVSECPEPIGAQHHKYSREQPSGSGPEGGHVRSFSLPQKSSNEEWRHKTQGLSNGQAREDSRVGRRLKSHMRGAGVADNRDDHQTKHNQAARDHSISEERDCAEGEQSMHNSLEELADLLGDEELPNEMEKGLPQREGKKDSASKAKSKSPNQKHRAESGVAADQSPPELDREEREKRKRQKQLQKQILLQRQQLKEQKLQEYLEKQKQKGKKDPGETPEQLRRNSDKRSPKEDATTREREQNSLKRHQHEAQQHSPGSPNRHHPDATDRNAVRERKREERDMVRSWAKAHKKAQKEAATRAAQQPVQPQHYPNTASEEPLYNRLAPLKPKEDDVDNEKAESRQSTENLPSSPPPPPYQPPSPAHKAAMGLVPQRVDGSSLHKEMGSPAQQRSHSSHTASTPPTPRFGDRRECSQSTLSNNSPRLAVNRPRHTQSFSGGSQLSSAGGSAAGSPRIPTRARSLKTSEYSPPKQNSPSLIAKRTGKEYGTVSEPVKTHPDEHEQFQHAHKRNHEMQIPIDPSALQKEDLTIAPHNFLNRSSSPPQDKLDKGEKAASVLTAPKKPTTQAGTYKLETALQEVMKSENLPPPPTHLLEISEQLEDIDYDELNAPPPAVSATALPPRADFEPQQQKQQPSRPQQEKRDINPEMLARSLNAPRNPTANATSYPPHIAKFMSRVRNSSTDADDPTQLPSKPTVPVTTTSAVVNDDVFMDHSHQQHPGSTKVDPRIMPDRQHYDVPRHVLGRTVSLENGSKQPNQPSPVSGARPRSNTLQVGRGYTPATSYSLPRGHYSSSAAHGFYVRPVETTPSPAHSHAHSDVNPENIWSREEQLQSSSTHSFQHTTADHTQNGLFRPHSRPPSVPIKVTRPAAGGGESIPNSPTYFTQHHPHRNEATPSPETQFVNQSFREHLTSLQPSRGTKRMNVASWMERSSDYWNSNKSAPFLKDSHTALPTNPRPHQIPHLSPPTPATSTPIFGPKHGHQQPVRATATPPFAPPILNRQLNPMASSASATVLQRSSYGAMGASQPLPSYPRPHSAKPTISDSYYILDV